MTKGLQVLLALKGLVHAALPSADLKGFDEAVSFPEVVPDGGMIVGFPGNPGDAQVDLGAGPDGGNLYNYEHEFPLELSAPLTGAVTIDDMFIALGSAVRANRYLGGLCCWLETTAPVREDRTTDDVTFGWAEVSIIAHYSTTDPLA